MSEQKPPVLIIGAGPAGLFAARKLAEDGYNIALLNRDIKPGGLAEYGIFYDKHVIKNGLRKQFREILTMPGIKYLGNITVGNSGDISLADLKSIGFKVILITAGAQGTKSLNIPGEESRGVYHAKDVVYHYNNLPPYSSMEIKPHGKVAIIGVGNVMMDIAHWAIHDLKVDEVIAIARRGPAEVKFSKKEMEYLINNLDTYALDKELARCEPFMKAVGQDPSKAREYILAAKSFDMEPASGSRLLFTFLSSPTRIIPDNQGRVIGLEIEENKLIQNGCDIKAVGLGTKRIIEVNSVVFCIGDKVEKDLGLPTKWDEFVKNPNPFYPVNGNSYEAYDLDSNQPLDGIFLAGWSREASSGLVGSAKKDGECCVCAVKEFINKLQISHEEKMPIDILERKLRDCGKQLVTKEDIIRLEKAEQVEGERIGQKNFKFSTNEDMFSAINSL